jgi:hypothetical protein
MMDISTINWAIHEPVILTVISDDTVLVARKHAPGAFVIIVDDTTGSIFINGQEQPDTPGEFVDVVVAAIAARGLMGPLDQTLGRPIEYRYDFSDWELPGQPEQDEIETCDVCGLDVPGPHPYNEQDEIADAAEDQRNVYDDDIFPPE